VAAKRSAFEWADVVRDLGRGAARKTDRDEFQFPQPVRSAEIRDVGSHLTIVDRRN
jgi:predicted secreted protein